MLKLTALHLIINSSKRLFLIGFLIGVTSMFIFGRSLAISADAADSKICAPCHLTELKAWENSPHAQTGISCDACHGPYVPEHRERRGTMIMDIESSSCKECHTETYKQWKSSPHAKAGVQCIGCHLSHSQKFRLTDEELCGSCHRQVLQELSHTAHKEAGITCTKCHASTVSSGNPGNTNPPKHTFTAVAEVCVGCHGKTIHEFVAQAKNKPQKPSSEQVLLANLEACEQMYKSVMPMKVVNLGVGTGIGGLAGVIFMLAFSYIRERRGKK